MASFTMEALKSNLPKRQCKYRTLLKSKDTERDRRRNMFLKKVKQAGDEKNWDVRADQILRSDYIARQKRWEEEQALSASRIPATLDDEEIDLEISPVDKQEFTLMEEILSQEEAELEDMFLPTEGQPNDPMEQQSSTTDYGSDDEEYNQLLIETLKQVEERTSNATSNILHQEDQHMEM